MGLIIWHAEVNYHRYKTGRADSSDRAICGLEDETGTYCVIARPTLEMDSIEEFCVKTEIIRAVASILKKGLLIEFRTKRVAKEITRATGPYGYLKSIQIYNLHIIEVSPSNHFI